MEDLLLLELANAVSAATSSEKLESLPGLKNGKSNQNDKTVVQWLSDLSPSIAEIFEELESYLRSLGDDVQRKNLKLYVAFKRLRNFTTVVFQNKALRLFLNLDPDHHPQR